MEIVDSSKDNLLVLPKLDGAIHAFQSAVVRFEPIPVVKSKQSITVPDMSYTPREIIAKFSRGERVPLGFKGLYDDDNASPFDDDPTRDPAFDFGDYIEEKYALDERMKERQRSSVKTAGDSKRKASDEEMSESDSTKRETTSGEAPAAPSGQ